MEHQITLWDSPNGINLPSKLPNCNSLIEKSVALKTSERRKILKAFDSELYDMALEYVWSRTIGAIRKKISTFGDEFIAEMLGRVSETDFTISSVSESDLINLAKDIGLINETARLEFQHIAEVIPHYANNDENEDIDALDTLKYLKHCVKYVLGMDQSEFCISFITFRDRLRKVALNEFDDDIQNLIISPYFYKRTTLRTLISLSKSSESAELEKVLSNLILIIPLIWDDIYPDDKYSLGQSYFEANGDNNSLLSSGFRKALLAVNGFDYVPENLRSNSFIKAANKLIDAHDGLNNFYNEPEHARLLSELGTSIPKPAFAQCISATLTCKMGNGYGVSRSAQPYLDKILQNVTPGRWTYYLNKVLVTDRRILSKLYSESSFERWKNIVKEYKLDSMTIDNPNISKVIQSSITSKHNQCIQAIRSQLKILS